MKEWLSQFDNLSIRIRLLITFATALIVFMLFDLFWFSENQSKETQLQTAINLTDKQLEQFIQTQNEINAGIYSARNNPKNKQLRHIQQQISGIKKELEDKALHMVKPEAMVELLKQIISRSKKLKLISLKKTPPENLFEEKDKNNQSVQMYRHAFVLSFEGGYQETLKFIKQLESMEQKVKFDQLIYSVDHYPKSRVSLVVSTYSLSRKWIGG